jgi:hypothetical protein
MHTNANTHTHTHTHMCVCVCARTYTYARTHARTYKYARTRARTHARTITCPLAHSLKNTPCMQGDVVLRSWPMRTPRHFCKCSLLGRQSRHDRLHHHHTPLRCRRHHRDSRAVDGSFLQRQSIRLRVASRVLMPRAPKPTVGRLPRPS